MGNIIHNEKTGFFLKRNNLINQRINHFIQELEVHLLELKIIDLTIKKLQNKELKTFDSVIGDRKCQTRSSIIIDLFQNLNFLNTELTLIKFQINNIIINTIALVTKIETAKNIELQQLTKELQQISFQDYINKHNLYISISKNLKIASLSLCTSLSKQELQQLCLNNISISKIDKLLVKAKIALCKISTEYEQDLSKKYGCDDEQKILTQIETKGFSSMTATYPSIKHILYKIKDNNQPLILKTIYFCSCGGIQNQSTDLFTASSKKDFIKTDIKHISLYSATMVIDGYQFPGSFE